MIAFAAIAFFLLSAAVAIVLWPLLSRSGSPVVGRELSNLDIHRDQFAELDKDLEAGTLGAERYEQAKTELERRVLEESAVPAAIPQSATRGKAVPAAVGILIPLIAVLLYLHLGNPQGLVATPHPAADMSSITADQQHQNSHEYNNKTSNV